MLFKRIFLIVTLLGAASASAQTFETLRQDLRSCSEASHVCLGLAILGGLELIYVPPTPILLTPGSYTKSSGDYNCGSLRVNSSSETTLSLNFNGECSARLNATCSVRRCGGTDSQGQARKVTILSESSFVYINESGGTSSVYVLQ
jgi:hypothetical protein